MTNESLNECRKAFEEYQGPHCLDKAEDGDYKYADTEIAWTVWQTAWNTRQHQAEQPQDDQSEAELRATALYEDLLRANKRITELSRGYSVMSDRQIIERLKDALHRMVNATMYKDHPAESEFALEVLEDADDYLTALGDALVSTVLQEADHNQPSPANSDQREISVFDAYSLQDDLSQILLDHRKPTVGNINLAKIVIDFLRPYLRTSEPDDSPMETGSQEFIRFQRWASAQGGNIDQGNYEAWKAGYRANKPVSLKVCIDKAQTAYNAEYAKASMEPIVFYQAIESAVKAVLDAAGVKYHED